jgi:excinuclease UvrABC ATPase subunit
MMAESFHSAKCATTIVYQQVRAIAVKYKFTLATPIKKIPKEALNMILYGSKEENGRHITQLRFHRINPMPQSLKVW